MKPEIRWQKRFINYKRAFAKLKLATSKPLASELEEEGLVQRFEYTYELAWKTLKDYMEYNGYTLLRSPAEVQQQAFQAGIISDGIGWKKMAEGRNIASHEYDEIKIQQLTELIKHEFVNLLAELYDFLTTEETKLP